MLVAASFAGVAMAADDPSIPPGFLAYPPHDDFAFEATHLFPARYDDLDVVEERAYVASLYDLAQELREHDPHPRAYERRYTDTTLAAVPAPLDKVVKDMRAAANGDAAYELGKDLPAAIRLYTAAAVDFRLAHTMITSWDPYERAPPPPGPMDKEEQAALGAAMARFQAVLRLPEAEKAPRAVPAAYMLGRGYVLRGLPGDLAEAEKAFVLTRSLARQGLPDPDGLAVASFGEQARVRRAQGDLASTIDLYAEQAVRGSGVGMDSLGWVAQALYEDPQGMAKVEDLPRAQRILIAYALRVNDDGDFLKFTYTREPDSPDQSDEHHVDRITPMLQIAKRWPREKIGWPDRMAALAYRAGDMDFARSLVADQDSALAWWIKAKLLIGDGKLAEAEVAYHKAVGAPSKFDDLGRLTPDKVGDACAEMIQLERARGEFTQAMGDALACDKEEAGLSVGLRADPVSYIAERTLTTRELKDFVDAQPAVVDGPRDANSTAPRDRNEQARIDLRSMLAQRLVREGRAAEAIPYADTTFDLSSWNDSLDTGLSKNLKTQRDLMQWYYTVQTQSVHAASNVEKAYAWYQQALVIRIHDDSITAHRSPRYTDEATPLFPGVSTSELVRLKSNYSSPDQDNLHWYIAYDDALKAAQLVPRRSQAYAAILCHAAHWMHQAPAVGDRDPERMFKAAWKLYLENGAHVSWAKSFGHLCPEPDFEAAAMPAWRREAKAFHVRLERHPLLVSSLLALLLLGSIAAAGIRFGVRKGGHRER